MWHGLQVREAAYAALAKVGKDSMHFRPPGEQNEHKITCGVQVGVLQQVGMAHVLLGVMSYGGGLHSRAAFTGCIHGPAFTGCIHGPR